MLVDDHRRRAERLDGGGQERRPQAADLARLDLQPARLVALVRHLADARQAEDVDVRRKPNASTVSALAAISTDPPGAASDRARARARLRRRCPSPIPSWE